MERRGSTDSGIYNNNGEPGDGSDSTEVSSCYYSTSSSENCTPSQSPVNQPPRENEHQSYSLPVVKDVTIPSPGSHQDDQSARTRMVVHNKRRYGRKLPGMPGLNQGLDRVPQIPRADINNTDARIGGGNFQLSSGAIGGGAGGVSVPPFQGNFNMFPPLSNFFLEGNFSGFPPHPNIPLGAGSGYGQMGFPGPINFAPSHFRQNRIEPYNIPMIRERYPWQQYNHLAPGYTGHILPNQMVNAANMSAASTSGDFDNGHRGLNTRFLESALMPANVTAATPSEVNVMNYVANSLNPLDILQRNNNLVVGSNPVPSGRVAANLTQDTASAKGSDSKRTGTRENPSVMPVNANHEETYPIAEPAVNVSYGSNNGAANIPVSQSETVQNVGVTGAESGFGKSCLPETSDFSQSRQRRYPYVPISSKRNSMQSRNKIIPDHSANLLPSGMVKATKPKTGGDFATTGPTIMKTYRDVKAAVLESFSGASPSEINIIMGKHAANHYGKLMSDSSIHRNSQVPSIKQTKMPATIKDDKPSGVNSIHKNSQAPSNKLTKMPATTKEDDDNSSGVTSIHRNSRVPSIKQTKMPATIKDDKPSGVNSIYRNSQAPSNKLTKMLATTKKDKSSGVTNNLHVKHYNDDYKKTVLATVPTNNKSLGLSNGAVSNPIKVSKNVLNIESTGNMATSTAPLLDMSRFTNLSSEYASTSNAAAPINSMDRMTLGASGGNDLQTSAGSQCLRNTKWIKPKSNFLASWNKDSSC